MSSLLRFFVVPCFAFFLILPAASAQYNKPHPGEPVYAALVKKYSNKDGLQHFALLISNTERMEKAPWAGNVRIISVESVGDKVRYTGQARFESLSTNPYNGRRLQNGEICRRILLPSEPSTASVVVRFQYVR